MMDGLVTRVSPLKDASTDKAGRRRRPAAEHVSSPDRARCVAREVRAISSSSPDAPIVVQSGVKKSDSHCRREKGSLYTS